MSQDTRHPRPDLALVLIVRNEARCIKRCLLSAREHVNRIVVLDTGSTDKTIEIARSCGAIVHQTVWNDDFSAARNLALDLADADWNLILDADEWIESGGESLKDVVRSSTSLGVVLVKSDFEVSGEKAKGSSWITRLLPRGVRYEGRIHEQVVSTLPRKRLPLVVGHDGYEPSQMAAKKGRNSPLLLKELALHPNDAYILFQLGKEYELSGDMATARDFYLRAKEQVPPAAPYAHELTMRLLYCLSKSERLQDAILLAGDEMGNWQDSPDYFFMLGNLFLDWAVQHPERAYDEWLPMAEEAWLRCLEIGDRPELEGTVAGRGSFLAAHNLSVIYGGRGDDAKAEHYTRMAESLRETARRL